MSRSLSVGCVGAECPDSAEDEPAGLGGLAGAVPVTACGSDAGCRLCARVHHAPERDLPHASHPRPPGAAQHAVCASDGAKVGVHLHLVCVQAFAPQNLGGKGNESTRREAGL